MLAIEEILRELNGEDDMNEQGLPPGFRFHPTDEELITFYLASKVFNGSFCGVDIAEVDLNRCEPWQLPDVAKMGEREWYFFSLRDRKYPTGLRTNRATGAGYWKATGKDREVYSSSRNNNGAGSSLLGMKKTLVFYKGRAPRGEKTKWVMHEYRLDGEFSCRHTCKEEWVICRIFHKQGDKKNAMLHGQQDYPSPITAAMPPLLEFENSVSTLLNSQSHNPMQMQSLQNPFSNQHSGLKSVVMTNPLGSSQPNNHQSPFPLISHAINGSQPSFPPTPNINTTITTTNKNTDTNNPSPSSLLFKSLLSHQESFTLEEQATVPKQCKTEANFNTHFQLTSDANLLWTDKFHQNYTSCQSTYPFGLDSSPFAAIHEIPTSAAGFNRGAGFQMMLDPPVNVVSPGSWPLDLQ
ncbi:hypothetical protein RJ640_020678 [Escallonia rubra]|uniref:NAC domain-containing protein n=1 Tax=Escallonia rubra TaxID=112253 RepID=A0AA88RY36_9ASTE|nr:hypothetical protein RJ640_020678 [Escallonia rubra]